jgi:Protein of unknown function (DUF3025)
MAKRRFQPPPREAVEASAFSHPVYAAFANRRDWFAAPAWPTLDALNAAMPVDGLRFVAQDEASAADGLHYERRIAGRGAIATRERNWHDLFNAAVWCRYPQVKQAINARQVLHIAAMGPTQRNRAQYALTQFDEAGAIVRVRDPALLALWDRHDWTGLFHAHSQAWRDGDVSVIAVIGHALLEMALAPELLMVAKCVVVQSDAPDFDDDMCIARVASAIADGAVLSDPQELRPLPLAGVPGWYPAQDAAFFASAPCFRPLRVGRAYPQPLGASA